MKTLKYKFIFFLIVFTNLLKAQVKTNFNNEIVISQNGKFFKDYKSIIDFEIPKKDINILLENDKIEEAKFSGKGPYNFAEDVPIEINIGNLTNWLYDEDYVYGKFTIRLNGALSSSINFNKFYLPKGTEMYIYNEKGNIITGPITENENNENKIWGSWIYRGEYLIIEIKTPIKTKNNLVLNSNNLAYGYKKVYTDRVNDFNQSEACNINVLCPLGIGWESERNSVGLILSDKGKSLCSGSMIMNTCNSNRPFFLTADHCFTGQDVSKWRFTFQAWSLACSPNQNSDGVTFNGSTLKANWEPSDFCLVELNNIAASNSGINYAGWDKSGNISTSATGIHHPNGDIMKICQSNNSIIRSGGGNYVDANHWQVNWGQGITASGSSGSPLFNSNKRIIGQLRGGSSFCIVPNYPDWYGSFDRSWLGGGTNSTRLSNWLDPNNSGAITTNTTNILNLVTSNTSLTISGDVSVCTISNPYTLPNLALGSSVVWSVSPSGIVTVNNPNALQTTITKVADGYVTLTATLTNCQGSITLPPKTVYVGSPYVNGVSTTYNVLKCIVRGYKFTIPNSGATNFKWFSRNITQQTPFVQFKNGAQNWATQGGDGSCDQTEIKVEATNACNTSSPVVYTFPSDLCPPFSDGSCGSARSITASPNPTSNNIEIAILEDPNVKSKNKQALKIEMIRVINKEGEIKKTIKGNNLAKMKIDISELPADIYNIIIFDGKTWISKQIVKN